MIFPHRARFWASILQGRGRSWKLFGNFFVTASRDAVADEPDGDAEPPKDPALLATSVSAALCDTLAHQYKGDETAAVEAITTIKSVDWGALPVDDLDALDKLFSQYTEDAGVQGAAAEFEVEEAEEEGEGDDAEPEA